MTFLNKDTICVTKKFALRKLGRDLVEFFLAWREYLFARLRRAFLGFEGGKGVFVILLYRQRGKLARPFVHFGMAGLSALSVLLAPVLAEEFPGQSQNPWELGTAPTVLSASIEQTATLVSDKPRDKIIEYTVREGDTLSGVAEKFGISVETIVWQNDLSSAKALIKPGQTLEILPVSGVSHKVAKGNTIYSIARQYSAEPQAIVDFPFNTFVNDETFALAVGQIIIVPEGVPPKEAPTAIARRQTPSAGTVVASGNFVWPAAGYISQNFVWYHKGIDIVNKAAPDILAADSGTVVVAGWPDNFGYGNRVVIDHGNGYRTLYAHMSQIYVVAGQTVRRGDSIGRMGSTGRSTGTHLHFEVIQSGVLINPLIVLR